VSGPIPTGDPADQLSDAEFRALVRSWTRNAQPSSPHWVALWDHLERIDWLPGSRWPLQGGQRVPGCPCADCRGIPADSPVRLPLPRAEGWWYSEAEITSARATPVVAVAAALGLGKPRREGSEWKVSCPLHEDHTPSLRLNPAKGLWFCDPCNEGGDMIALWRATRRVSFRDAVWDLLSL
jgi:hypothetical protein